KPKRPKTRNAAARRCLRWRRSSATSSNVGNRWGVRSGTTAPNLDLRHLQGGERLPQLRLADLPGWRVRQLLEHHPLLRDLVRGEVVPREAVEVVDVGDVARGGPHGPPGAFPPAR